MPHPHSPRTPTVLFLEDDAHPLHWRIRRLQREAKNVTDMFLSVNFFAGLCFALGIAGLAAIFGGLAPGTRWAFNASHPQSLSTVDHVVARIARQTPQFSPPMVINQPLSTATSWDALALARYYNTAIAHPRQALIPQTFTIHHHPVTIVGGWLTNGTVKWQWSPAAPPHYDSTIPVIRGTFTAGLAPFAHTLTTTWSSAPTHRYALVQPLTFAQASTFWERTLQPNPYTVAAAATPPAVLESFSATATHNPAYLVLWVTSPTALTP